MRRSDQALDESKVLNVAIISGVGAPGTSQSNKLRLIAIGAAGLVLGLSLAMLLEWGMTGSARKNFRVCLAYRSSGRIRPQSNTRSRAGIERT
jgi:hypothetical protein